MSNSQGKIKGSEVIASALADAGIEMLDLVSSIAVGNIEGNVIADLDYAEEAWDGEVADIPLAFIPSTGEISLLQMDGFSTKEQLIEGLEIGKAACEKISEIQKQAIKSKYEVAQ